jgi:hypothetical protein
MYRVRLARRAERGLRRIRQGDPRAYERIVVAIRLLGEDPRPAGAVKLAAFAPPGLAPPSGRIPDRLRDP